jgi:hypothetical protein
MKKMNWIIIALIAVMAFSVSAQINGSVFNSKITSSCIIWDSGEYWVDNDIRGDVALSIVGSDVVIHGNNHVLSANNAIHISSKRVTIENCIIYGAESAIIIAYESGDNTIVNNNINGVISVGASGNTIEENSGDYSIIVSSLVTNVTSQPSTATIMSNYPNPFNPSTKIRFYLPKSAHVRLNIYNLSGQRIDTLVDEVKSAGSYEINWDASSCPAGTYVYRLVADGISKTGRMNLLK